MTERPTLFGTDMPDPTLTYMGIDPAQSEGDYTALSAVRFVDGKPKLIGVTKDPSIIRRWLKRFGII